MPTPFRDHGHHDKCPCPDHPGTVRVGMGLVATRLAEKFSLIPSIGAFAMSAFRTGLARVGRGDDLKPNTVELGLVLKAFAKESPKPARKAPVRNATKPE